MHQLNAVFEEDWHRQAGGAAVSANKTAQEQRASLDRSHTFLAAMMDKACAASSVTSRDRQRPDPVSDSDSAEEGKVGCCGSRSDSSRVVPDQQQPAQRGAANAESPEAGVQPPVPRVPPPAMPAAAAAGGGEPDLPNSTFECPMTLVRSIRLLRLTFFCCLALSSRVKHETVRCNTQQTAWHLLHCAQYHLSCPATTRCTSTPAEPPNRIAMDATVFII